MSLADRIPRGLDSRPKRASKAAKRKTAAHRARLTKAKLDAMRAAGETLDKITIPLIK